MDQAALRIERSNSFDQIQNLLKLLKLKDRNTFEHSNRVYSLTREWATWMRAQWKWTDLDLAALELAALLHDLGKVGVLDEILNKPDLLTSVERDHLEQHAEIGFRMLNGFSDVEDIALGIRHHHERWDGHGYPLRLRENEIPKIARIISVVDTYDAITSDRPYRQGRSSEIAIRIIESEAGRQFCPEIAIEFIQFLRARNA